MRYFLYVFILTVISCKEAKTPEPRVIEESSPWRATVYYDSVGNLISSYNILEPLQIDEGEEYPLVLFLHGSGERGDDNIAQLIHIAPIFASDSIRNLYPSYVIFPQCPAGESWGSVDNTGGNWTPLSSLAPEKALVGLMKLLDNVIDIYPVDTNRIYISGLSMGGFGTFDYLARDPNKFAAAIPICGGGDTAFAKNYAHVPMKIFHGADDQVVSPQLSRDMYQSLLQAGAKDVEYIEFPGVGHDAWTPAYQYEGLLDWMYSQDKMK